jgi:hypothetical protein
MLGEHVGGAEVVLARDGEELVRGFGGVRIERGVLAVFDGLRM